MAKAPAAARVRKKAKKVVSEGIAPDRTPARAGHSVRGRRLSGSRGFSHQPASLGA